MKRWILGGLLFALGGCAGPLSETRASTPETWRLGFGVPAYMEVWVETAGVKDVRGYFFAHVGSGTASVNYGGSPEGWPARPGSGAGRDVLGADLPAEIYIRWQSLVEPQTYEVTLEIPEHVRELMRQREPMPRHLPERRLSPRNHVVVGLAPGGIVKVWNSGSGLQPEAVMCVHATVVEQGPYGGESGGRHRPLSERALPYVSTNPIPYESWTCDES